MVVNRRQFMQVAGSTGPSVWGLATAVGQAQAQPAPAFPQKPITVFLPFPAGGVADNVVRMIGERFREKTGQPWVVVNKPGASGAIAMAGALQAPRDAHTLFFGTSAIVIRAATNEKFAAAFDSGMIPLSETVRGALLLGVNPKVPVRTLKDLLDYSRRNPSQLNFGVPGIGSSSHFGFEFLKMKGLSATSIPFTGGPPVLQALLQGEVQILMEAAPLVKAHVDSGAIRPLAVTSRSAQYPGVPTLEEAGVPGLDLDFWMGFFVPAGSPEPAIGASSQLLAGIVQEPETNRQLQAMGYQPIGSKQAEFAARLKELRTAFGTVARTTGMPTIE